MPKNNINYTYVIVAAILGLAISLFAILNYVSKEKDRKIAEQRQEETKSEERRNELKLDGCIREAEADYQKLLELNSAEVPDKENVRQWNSLELQKRTEEKLNTEKELCRKIFNEGK